uniref:Uncharacterized protein n=1 Tax=Tanacetum cinerariifolium TaxID=118510 RepID=A0A6L2JI13_TANCI|nr:hypothetical protein [Tanacetum cinerariifolium]
MSSDTVKRHIGTRQALVIYVSSDVSVESVRSSFLRVILIGCIFVKVLVSPESDTEIPERHVSPTLYDDMLNRWRSRVASQSSSPTTSNPKIPTAPILPASSTVVAPSSEELMARKSVRPLPSHCLALRYTSHHLDSFTFGSSSGHSSLDHSSSRHSILGHSLSEHASPDTTIADSSTPSRFVYPPLARTLRCSKAYLHWRSAPLSTMYPPTTSESLARDSSSESSDGPSLPSRADLLPPRKRFKDSISPEDSVEKDIDMDVLEDIKADATTIKVTVDRDVKAEVDAGMGMKVDVGIDVEDEVKEQVESSDRGTIERIEDIEIGQRELEARCLIAGGERASLLERVTSLERSNASLQGTVMMESMRANRFWRRMRFIKSELRQIHRFCYYNRM